MKGARLNIMPRKLKAEEIEIEYDDDFDMNDPIPESALPDKKTLTFTAKELHCIIMSMATLKNVNDVLGRAMPEEFKKTMLSIVYQLCFTPDPKN